MATNITPGAEDQPPVALFHVGTRAIPIGEALRPYAIAHEQSALIRAAEEALADGADAIVRLLSSPAWRRRQGNFRPEMVLLEAVFERVRVRIAPSSPSRLEAVFAWASLDLARRFCAEYCPNGIIHRCALVAGPAVERDGALVVDAFAALELAAPLGEQLRRVEERAVRYWRGEEPMAFPELLVRGIVTVEAIVGADGIDRPG